MILDFWLPVPEKIGTKPCAEREYRQKLNLIEEYRNIKTKTKNGWRGILLVVRVPGSQICWFRSCRYLRKEPLSSQCVYVCKSELFGFGFLVKLSTRSVQHLLSGKKGKKSGQPIVPMGHGMWSQMLARVVRATLFVISKRFPWRASEVIWQLFSLNPIT